ncbi:MAG: diacylglycerol kinase family protein [Bacilli bacterium]|nr:diacylglycerol kinase family protein [Bacilli bacterium]
MTMVSRDKLKQRGFKRLFKSFKYAFDGLKYAFKYEQNILVHTLATILVIIFGIYFKLSSLEWVAIFLSIGLVIATELINTSIEATIDLITNQVNPLAKIAKDTAAGAVLVFGFTALVIGLIIFLPKIMGLFVF